LQIGDIKTKPSKSGAVRINLQDRQAGDLFRLWIAGARRSSDDAFDLPADFKELIKIIAIDFHGDVSAHAGNEFVKTHLNRLRELIAITRKLIHGSIHLSHELRAGLSRIRPVFARV